MNGYADVHRRLRSLSVVREASIQDMVAAMIEEMVRQVRLPSVGGSAPEHEGAPAGRAD